MSYLILVVNRTDWEYGVTIAAVPLAILVLFLCAFSARRENIPLMVLSIACFVAGGVYFIYKVRCPATRGRNSRLTVEPIRLPASTTPRLPISIALSSSPLPSFPSLPL